MCAAFAYQLLNLKVIKLLTRQFGAFYSVYVCVLCGWRPSTSAIKGHDELHHCFFFSSPKRRDGDGARGDIFLPRPAVVRSEIEFWAETLCMHK